VTGVQTCALPISRREQVALLAFAAGCAALAVGALFWQNRWGSVAAPALVVLVLAGLIVGAGRPGALCRRGALVAALVAVLGAQAFLTARQTLAGDRAVKSLEAPDMVLASFLVVRDVADVLRYGYGVGATGVLSGEWSSLILAYEGGVRVVPTLYWENAAGLRAANDIFVAQTDEEALRLLAARGITHLVVVRSDFNPGEMYYRKYGRVDRAALARTLAQRIAAGKPPAWLEPLYYQCHIGQLRGSILYDVSIFRVNPGGTG
jgi:hypothetical protein